MSDATTTIQNEFGLRNEEIGNILAGFALGYFCFQVPGDWIGTKFGARIVLPALSVLWSLCTFWFGMAGSGWQLRCSRIALGLAQAGLIPCCAKVIADWFPVVQRGLASAILAQLPQFSEPGAVFSTT
jgi:MFS family permease